MAAEVEQSKVAVDHLERKLWVATVNKESFGEIESVRFRRIASVRFNTFVGCSKLDTFGGAFYGGR